MAAGFEARAQERGATGRGGRGQRRGRRGPWRQLTRRPWPHDAAGVARRPRGALPSPRGERRATRGGRGPEAGRTASRTAAASPS